MPDADLLELLQRLAMALGIGFLVGIERGWRHRDAPEGTRAAGLRTHALIGLFGGVCGAVLPLIGAVGFAALTLSFSAALIAFKLRESSKDDDVSVTGTLAALLLFALGVYAMRGDLRVVAAVGVTLVGLLAFKDGLHNWLGRLSWNELRSALLILAATAIALPLLPDRTIDPWDAINLRDLWLLTIFVAGASFAGYVCVRVLGAQTGVLAGAIAGALVSSTIVTAELGRRVRSGATSARTAAAGAALAAATSLARVVALAAVVAVPVAWRIAPTLFASAAVFVGVGLVWRRGDAHGSASGANVTLQSPLDLRVVAQFALVLGGLMALGRIVSDAFGESGLLPFAASAGLADVDTVTLAASSLVNGGLDLGIGAHAVLIAVLANTAAKCAIAVATGGWRYGGPYLLAAAAALLVGAAVWWFATPLLIQTGSLELGWIG
jgi:uncharacterized membrane protein (DUF4010 family)